MPETASLLLPVHADPEGPSYVDVLNMLHAAGKIDEEEKKKFLLNYWSFLEFRKGAGPEYQGQWVAVVDDNHYSATSLASAKQYLFDVVGEKGRYAYIGTI